MSRKKTSPSVYRKRMHVRSKAARARRMGRHPLAKLFGLEEGTYEATSSRGPDGEYVHTVTPHDVSLPAFDRMTVRAGVGEPAVIEFTSDGGQG